MFKTVLVADSGVGAARVRRTLERLGIAMSCAPQATAEDADGDAITVLAAAAGADVVHPGYGARARDAHLGRALARCGIAFAGARADDIETFSDPGRARSLAHAADLPLLARSRPLGDLANILAVAAAIGYPVALFCETSAWERRCAHPEAVRAAWEEWRRSPAPGLGMLCVERRLAHARCLEVPVWGDGRGAVRALGVHDVSLRRDGRALLEEAPAGGLAAGECRQLMEGAVRLARHVRYMHICKLSVPRFL